MLQLMGGSRFLFLNIEVKFSQSYSYDITVVIEPFKVCPFQQRNTGRTHWFNSIEQPLPSFEIPSYSSHDQHTDGFYFAILAQNGVFHYVKFTTIERYMYL